MVDKQNLNDDERSGGELYQTLFVADIIYLRKQPQSFPSAAILVAIFLLNSLERGTKVNEFGRGRQLDDHSRR